MNSDSALETLRHALVDTATLHLNNAGVAPLSTVAAEAINAAVVTLGRGTLDIGETIVRVEAARASIARLVGAEARDVAFFQTCALALTQAAFGIGLRAGDEIVLLDQEYPSNAYPWHRAAEAAGAKVHVVASRPDFTVDASALQAAIGPRTRVVACSWVQFQTGTTLDLRALADTVHRHGGLLVVDAIQGLGALPFDLHEMGADLVCGGGHKWLLGPLGVGFLAARPGLVAHMEPRAYGAMSYGTPDDPTEPARALRDTAKRFEPGAPPALAAPGLGAAVSMLLSIGLERIERENRMLSDRLTEGLAHRDLVVLPRADRGAIVTFLPRREPTALVAALRTHGVSVALRAGGVRVAPHIHNGPQHIDRFLNLLDELDR